MTNQQTHDEMLELGGEDRIPFLVGTGRGETLYESDEIMAYLDRHYG